MKLPSGIKLIISRFNEQRIPQAAASLTFTTVLALVPLLAVVVTIMTAMPIMGDFKSILTEFLRNNLVPVDLSAQILNYIDIFVQQTRHLTAFSSIFLLTTSILLMKNIDDTINDIWYVKYQRTLTQRLLMYWAILTIGPVLLALSVFLSSGLADWVLGATQQPDVRNVGLFLLTFVLAILRYVLVYMVVPNRRVRFKDALIGSVLAALSLAVLRYGFGFYISHYKSYTIIYGAFAVVPLFLLWVYMGWLITLVCGMITAALPGMRNGDNHFYMKSGNEFVVSLLVLKLLLNDRNYALYRDGRTLENLAMNLKVSDQVLSDALWMLRKKRFVQLGKNDKWLLTCSDQTDLSCLIQAQCLDRPFYRRIPADHLQDVIKAIVENPKAVTIADLAPQLEASAASEAASGAAAIKAAPKNA